MADLVAAARRVTAQDLAIDDERHVGGVGVRGALVHLVGEFHDRVRPIVEESLQASEPPLGVVANPVRDLHVLALDDGSHGAPPKWNAGYRV